MSAFQRVLDAEMQRTREALIEQINQPLWFLGPQPDQVRSGWPRRYVLFPPMEAVNRRRLRVKRWWDDRARPAIEVLRYGMPERDY